MRKATETYGAERWTDVSNTKLPRLYHGTNCRDKLGKDHRLWPWVRIDTGRRAQELTGFPALVLGDLGDQGQFVGSKSHLPGREDPLHRLATDGPWVGYPVLCRYIAEHPTLMVIRT